MSTNITLKTRIRVNGREYASVGDLPADLRQAYERAVAQGAGTHGNLTALARRVGSLKSYRETCG